MYLTPDDLAPFAEIDEAKARAMIADAEATAATVAPCITEDEFINNAVREAYVKSVIRGAVLRWHESGTGAFQQQTAGPFTVGMDTRQQRRGMFFPSEIEQLQDACKRFRGQTSQAFSVDTAPRRMPLGVHRDICDLAFGGDDCSCGAVLTLDEPLFEGGGYS